MHWLTFGGCILHWGLEFAEPLAGYQLLWVLVWILVPACLLQSQAVRLAVVTNQDLAHLVRNEYAASPNVRNLVIATSHAALVSHLIPQVAPLAQADMRIAATILTHSCKQQ